jgi:hypothetical protein
MFGNDYKLLKGYEQILNKFYNELIKKKKSGQLEDIITEGWKNKLFGQTDNSSYTNLLFYDALNSYVNLVYFDSMLEDSIGKVI